MSSIISAVINIEICEKLVEPPQKLHSWNCFPPGHVGSPLFTTPEAISQASYILAIERSVDPGPLIIELRHSVLANRSDISSTVLDCLSAAKASVANIHSATFKNHARHNLRSAHIVYWKSKLEPLTVQNKF